MWTLEFSFTLAEASPYEPEALPSIPQGTPEAPQHPAMLLVGRGLNHQSWKKHTNETNLRGHERSHWKFPEELKRNDWFFQNRLRYWNKLRIHRGWARLQAGFRWPKLIPPLRGHNLESRKGQWFRDILPMKSCMASLKMMIIWAYDIFIMTLWDIVQNNLDKIQWSVNILMMTGKCSTLTLHIGPLWVSPQPFANRYCIYKQWLAVSPRISDSGCWQSCKVPVWFFESFAGLFAVAPCVNVLWMLTLVDSICKVCLKCVLVVEEKQLSCQAQNMATFPKLANCQVGTSA